MNGKNIQLYLLLEKVPPPLHINRTEAVICVKIPTHESGIFCILISYIFKNRRWKDL